MTPVFERAKTFHALDRAATVTGAEIINSRKLKGTKLVLPLVETGSR
jgi:ribosomal protein L34